MQTNLARLLLMTVVFLLLALAAQAHPPSDIKLSYDKKTKILMVTVLHNVSQHPQGHYIKEVDATLDGTPVVMQFFASQTDKTVQKVQYTIIDVKPGSMVSVKATCSIRGDKTVSLKVP